MMNIRELLEQYNSKLLKIEKLKKKILEISNADVSLGAFAYDDVKVQAGRQSSKVESQAITRQDTMDEMHKMIDDLEVDISITNRAIGILKSKNQKIIRMKYISNLSIGEIADELCMSDDGVMKNISSSIITMQKELELL